MRKDILILGIHDGDNCGASLTCNGVVVASMNEERLSRVKDEVGFPARSIREVLRLGGVDASELHEVVYASKPETYGHLTAGSHPKDRTLRPQVVTREANPGYHSISERFEALTGIGVIMNTSLNQHGHPICADARDGIEVFLNSGLDHLALNNHLLSKSDRG